MDSRERVIRTLQFNYPDRVPRDLWALPGTYLSRKNELDEIYKLFPIDFTTPVFSYGKGYRSKGIPNIKGNYVDEWGCQWSVLSDGVIGEVKNPPITELEQINKLKPPYEILDNADLSKVNESCSKTDKFVLICTTVRPFERIQFLIGTERLFTELAYGTKEIFTLINIVHEFFLKEIELWCKTDVDGIQFMDDWGSQNNLLIPLNMWREIFKPLYKDYCDIIKKYKKFVFFHSDGNISLIFPDLIELGINAVNSQLFCMDIEELGMKYKEKITFWGEIDRQYILPFGTKEEIKNAVKRIKNALYSEKGGIIAQCEMGIDVPKENIITVFETWEEIDELYNRNR